MIPNQKDGVVQTIQFISGFPPPQNKTTPSAAGLVALYFVVHGSLLVRFGFCSWKGTSLFRAVQLSHSFVILSKRNERVSASEARRRAYVLLLILRCQTQMAAARPRYP
jgi:hypothetical protein